MRSRWRLILGTLVSAVFLTWAIAGLNIPAFLGALRSAQYAWLLPGVAIYFLGVWARTWRWQYMLRPIRPLGLGPLFRLVCIGYMGNNVFPARAGEVLRSYALKQEHGVSISSSLATVLIERLFDGLTMLLFVFVALPLVRFETAALERFRASIAVFTLLFVGALVVFLAIAARPHLARRLADWLAQRILPFRYRQRAVSLADRFLVGFESLASGRAVVMIFVTSVFVWLCETAKYWFVMHAFPFATSFVTLMLMNGIVNLFTTLPAAPGYLGTFDAPGIAVLEAAGVNKAVATAYTLVLHVALWLPITLLGAVYLWRSRLNWRQATTGVEEPSADGAGGQAVHLAGGSGGPPEGWPAAGLADSPRPPVGSVEGVPGTRRPTVGSVAGAVGSARPAVGSVDGLPAPPRVLVVGAGFAGLAATYDVARAGAAVTLLEAMDRPGGLAAGFRDDAWDWSLDYFYHHLFTSDYDAMALARETGFGDRLIVRRPITAYQYRGQPYALDGVIPVLRFPGIPFVDRVRMGLVIAYLKLRRDWRQLEETTVRAWVCRWMGEPAYRVIWEPLLLGKFGDYHDGIPMSWLWARLHKRSMRLIYFEGGFQAFADHLQATVEQLGADVRLSTPAEEVRQRPDGVLEVVTARGVLEADRVIWTAAPHELARRATDLRADYRARLLELRHLGAIVVVLALDRQLMPRVYWLSLDKREFPFLACVEHTNFMPRQRYGGDHLVYLGDYPPSEHRVFGLSDEELLAEWLPAVRTIHPEFERRWIRRSWVFRQDYAQPVFPLHYSRLMPSVETPWPGLVLASMSQVYPWDRGTNYAVALGRQVAAKILGRPSAVW